MAFGGSDVYLEPFGERGWAPRFGFDDVRISVNGIVVGRAWTGAARWVSAAESARRWRC
jgi:hypothetical protein